MKEQLISFNTAKLAKTVGFNIPVDRSWSDKDGKVGEYEHFYFFNDDEKVKDHYRFPLYSAPTQSLLQKWLRDVHGIFIGIDCFCGMYRFHAYNVDVYNDKYPKYLGVEDTYLFEFGTEKYIQNSYEEALEEGLSEALKFIIYEQKLK